jgi:hypothetical protein
MYLNANKMSSNKMIAPHAAPKAIPILVRVFAASGSPVGVGEEVKVVGLVVSEEALVVNICVNSVGLAEVEGTEVAAALAEDAEVAEDVVGAAAEVRACSEE